VDFSEARDLFVNIFFEFRTELKNHGPRVNFGKPEGLSAKSGPRVDFTKVQGPLCKISE
jgi:hypothetical protein